jgi:hypothetical protein
MSEERPRPEDFGVSRETYSGVSLVQHRGVSWGYQPTLREEVAKLAKEAGYPLVRLHGHDPQKSVIFGGSGWRRVLSLRTPQHRLQQAHDALREYLERREEQQPDD